MAKCLGRDEEANQSYTAYRLMEITYIFIKLGRVDLSGPQLRPD